MNKVFMVVANSIDSDKITRSVTPHLGQLCTSQLRALCLNGFSGRQNCLVKF